MELGLVVFQPGLVLAFLAVIQRPFRDVGEVLALGDSVEQAQAAIGVESCDACCAVVDLEVVLDIPADLKGLVCEHMIGSEEKTIGIHLLSNPLLKHP